MLVRGKGGDKEDKKGKPAGKAAPVVELMDCSLLGSISLKPTIGKPTSPISPLCDWSLLLGFGCELAQCRS